MDFYRKTGSKSISGSIISSSNVIQGTTSYFDGKFNKNSGVLSIPSEEKIIDKIMKILSKKQVVQHKCQNCGASLEVDIDNHLFKCGYCGSVYFIGTQMINDK